MTKTHQQSRQPLIGENWLTGSGLVSAIAALIGASCCVLPLILFEMGIGSAVIGSLGFFAGKTAYFLLAALLFIAVGVIASFWRGRRPRKPTLIMFALSIFIVVLAYILPGFEGDILRWLNFS